MTEEIEVTEELMAENGHNPILEMTRKVLLAGIGAVALTQEEVEKFVTKLVDRGEIAEKDGRKLINDVMEKRRKKTAEVRAEAKDELDMRIEQLFERMDVPTKTDIDALSAKITALTKKVDELKKAQS